jgi:hypothetical protein
MYVEIVFTSNINEVVRIRRCMNSNGDMAVLVNGVQVGEEEFAVLLLNSKLHV